MSCVINIKLTVKAFTGPCHKKSDYLIIKNTDLLISDSRIDFQTLTGLWHKNRIENQTFSDL